MKAWAEKFYKSKQWQRCQHTVMERDSFLCQDCLKHGIITPATEVHHIKWLTPDNINDPSVSLNPDNLISLCHDCHMKRHAGKKRYRIDKNGRVIVL